MNRMKMNKKAFSWLQIVIVLAILVLVVYAVFNLFLPQITAAAEALNLISPDEKPNAEYAIATLETYKGLAESYLARIGTEIELQITLRGEIHRRGFLGEECFVCTDYVFEKSERIPLTELRLGARTMRIDANSIVGGADEANLEGIDEDSVEITAGPVQLVQKGHRGGSTRAGDGTWNVFIEMIDENGAPMRDETNKPLKLLLATVSDAQTYGREITYQVRPAYEYDETDEEQRGQEPTEVAS